jgi:hypothetical protein
MTISVVLLCVAPISWAEGTIVKVLPFATDRQVRIQAVVKSTAPVEVTGRIAAVEGGDVLWEGSLGAGSGSIEKTVSDLKPRLWSPGSPTLYNLTVTAKQDGRDVGYQTVRFGFRSVTRGDGQILLNGHPIFLRGIAINPPERDIPNSVGYSKKFAHDYVKYLRSQNVNLIRMTFNLQDDPRQQVWFDACDELGMMVYQGNYASPPSGDGTKRSGKAVDPEENPEAFAAKGSSKRNVPKDMDRSVAAYEKVFETYARHPSIIIYILANELPGPVGSNSAWHEYLTEAAKRIHAWDPSRLIIGNAGYGLGREGDINDVHRYWGWYYNSFLTYYNLRDSVKLFGESTEHQPFTFSECVGSFTSPLGSFNEIYRKQLAAQLGWTGHSPDQKNDSLAYQAFMVKHALESFRTMREQNHRISGLMPFTILFFNWEGIRSFEEMKPKPAMEQMGVSYQPVLLSWEMWTPNVYPGTQVKAIAHVVNDAEDFSGLNGAKLEITVVSMNPANPRAGMKVVSQTVALPSIPYGSAKAIPVEIELPAHLMADDYLLRGRIVRGGETVSKNQTAIFVYSPLSSQRSLPMLEVGVYDPSGKAEAALSYPWIKIKPITRLSNVKGVKTLVIGEMAFDKSAAGALRTFVQGGGRVLCLAQDADKFDPSWLPAKMEMLHGTVTNPTYPTKDRPTADGQNVNPERPWHPVFEEIDRRHLQLWSDYTNWDQSKPGFPRVLPVMHGFRLIEPNDLPKVSVIGDYDRGLEGVAIAEFFDGKGSVVFTGLDLVSRAKLDPVADKMLQNLVAYVAGEDHETQPLIEKPIVWGNYSTERGVITGPVNGFVYNCRWVAPPTAPDAKAMPDNGGAWNTHPGNPFVTVGVRAVGPFGYSTGSSPRENKEPNGSGMFCCRVPAGRKVVVSKVQNVDKQAMSMAVSVNRTKGEATSVPAVETILIRSEIPNRATELTVKYSGDKRLVILETSFE